MTTSTLARLSSLALVCAPPLLAQSAAPARDEIVNLDKFEVAETTGAYTSPITLAKGAQSLRTVP
ncbi:MAG: hypothetical protein V4773_27220, partial [Verrucomicrobiota bacterium]